MDADGDLKTGSRWRRGGGPGIWFKCNEGSAEGRRVIAEDLHISDGLGGGGTKVVSMT